MNFYSINKIINYPALYQSLVSSMILKRRISQLLFFGMCFDVPKEYPPKSPRLHHAHPVCSMVLLDPVPVHSIMPPT